MKLNRLLVWTLLGVTATHFIVSIALDSLTRLPFWQSTLLEAVLLFTFAILPIWFWLYRPHISALQKKINIYKQAEETFGIVQIIDPNGTIKQINENFCRISKYSQRELVGQPIQMLKSDRHPPDFFKTLFENVQSQKVWHGQICFCAKDKSLFWLDTVLIPSFDSSGKIQEYFSIHHDLTENYTLLENARRHRDRLEIALRKLNFSVFEFNLGSQELVCDDLLFEMFGVHKGSFIGDYRIFQKCILTHDLVQVNEHLKSLLDNKNAISLEFNIRRPLNGQKCLLRIEIDLQCKDDGTPQRLIGVVRDVTQTRENELKLLYSSKMSSLGEMASGIAHEINNPLTIIMGKVSQINRMLENEQVENLMLGSIAGSIQKTSDRIAKIVKGLRSFARDDGQDPFVITSVSTVIADTIELCKSRFHHQGIELRIEEVNTSLDLECHPNQISQILLNLLGNSADAITPLSEKWVQIEVSEEAEHIRFEITDSGSGIPGHLREKILQPFFTTKEVGKGTGLGLSISAAIAKTHQGELTIDDSCPNTRFVLRIPHRQNLITKNSQLFKSA